MGNYTGVQLTYAASGSSGITVADNDNIDFGTGNFTMRWKGALPDWTPSVDYTPLIVKFTPSTGYFMGIRSTGHLYAQRNDVGANSSVVLTISNGTIHDLVAVITVGSANSLVDFYVDGVALGVQQTLAGVLTTSNASTLEILGYSGARYEGTTAAVTLYNRALTAAEVKSLENGVAEADKWGSQTELITTQTNRDFSGANNWENGNFNSFDNSGDLSITASAGGQWCRLPPAAVPMTTGIRYRLSFDVANPVSTFYLLDDNITHYLSDSTSPITFTAGRYTSEFTYLGTGGGIVFYAGSATSSGDFDNFSLTRVGATIDLEPSGIELDKWYDNSTNDLDASYPSVGYYLMPKIFSGIYKRRMRIFKKR